MCFCSLRSEGSQGATRLLRYAPALRVTSFLAAALFNHGSEIKISLPLKYKHNFSSTPYAWGRQQEALALHKKKEAICLELSNKDGLQRSYGNQAVILQEWGQLEEALALHKKEEAICLELGNKDGLGHCYWNWGLLARQQGDKQTERQKLEQALAIFAELNMPSERDAVQAELDKTDAA